MMDSRLFILIGAGVLLIGLQIVLSLKKNGWLWLILPTITFFCALTVSISSLLDDYTRWSGIADAAVALLLYNIPTVILLAVYAVCRGRTRDTVEQMSVQDLE